MLGKNCTIYLLYNLKSKSQKYPSVYLHTQKCCTDYKNPIHTQENKHNLSLRFRMPTSRCREAEGSKDTRVSSVTWA